MAKNTLLDSEERLEPYVEGWDRLAVECRRPLTAPGWMLSWWRNAAPEGARLRCVAVEDRGRLIGFAPFYVARTGRHDYRLLAPGLSQRIEPLAERGRDEEVAGAVVEALRSAEPRPAVVAMEGIPADSPWPALLKRGMGGALGAAWRVTGIQDAPVVTLSGDDFDGWLASKSSNFRSQMKRARRKIEKEGGVIRMSDESTVEADIEAFFRLHEGRWENRGESALLASGLPGMLRGAALALLESGRFRLAMIDFDGRAISAQLFMAAGGEVAYWNGGFDEEWARYKPAMVAIFFAIEDAFQRGDDRLDLGGGAQDYKLRFADSLDPIQWGAVIPRGPRWPLVSLQLVPEVARKIALGALSKERRDRLKKLLRR